MSFVSTGSSALSSVSSIGSYLLRQLHRHGVRRLFGVPGDYVLGFYRLIEHGPIPCVGMTREDAAGFAADAYARLNGMGAAVVTFGVGGLSMVNSVAEAYAEKSPVVVISGAPGMKERRHDPLLHHRVRDFSMQREIFDKITVAGASLEDPLTAGDEIDRVLHAVERYKRPGYIELPRDRVDAPCAHVHRDRSLESMTDAAALAECLGEVAEKINRARRPVILADVEVHRFGLQDALARLVDRTRIPVAATILGKSVIRESHPYYLGVYQGAMGPEAVRRRVESSDCLLMLGWQRTDINLGVYTANLDLSRAVCANSEKVVVGRHVFEDVPFRSFVNGLLGAPLTRRGVPSIPRLRRPARPRADGARISLRTLFPVINDCLSDEIVVVTDSGDCLFGAIDLRMHRCSEFVSPAFYLSMGFGVPAAIGVQLARRSLRPLVLVGDGAFQMTGMELSTAARLGLNPVVVILNNHGYSTQRQILDGSFNNIHGWSFDKVPEVLRAGRAFSVRTVDEMRRALRDALAYTAGFSLIDVDLDPYDASPALGRLGRRLGEHF